ncbi:MAG TPA: hypothetical protein VG455_13255 [Acidimicrobiales bacterium]|nr:hypothetical protein [Acidimicrobiales bacterium]
MARIVDTIPAFVAFARKANIETPIRRELLWKERYESEHPDVFEAFNPQHGSTEGRTALAKELSTVRARVEAAEPVVRSAIEEIDPLLAETLGLPPEPSPVHVLLVGSFATNAAVGQLGDDVAVFHCLEWFQSPEGARVLVAHEGTHAWARMATGEAFPEDDAAALAFAEGVAIAASRAVIPDRPPEEYFWYGHGEVEHWLPWCEEHRDQLLVTFAEGLGAPETVDAFFGGGFVETQWRVGYYLADQLVQALDKPLPELARMTVAEGRAAILDVLGLEEAPLEEAPEAETQEVPGAD